MNILELDAGNSRLKWRLSRDGEVVDRGGLPNRAAWNEHLPMLLDRLGRLDIVRASVVSGSARLGLLKEWVQQLNGVQLQIARTQASLGPVRVTYKEFNKLGVDRWLAMLAAQAATPGTIKVVVDCGTAITLDVLDETGLHKGGFIVPGLSLMKNVLAVNTADLLHVEPHAQAIELGAATEECINHGILAMAVALVQRVHDSNKGSSVVLTGGDASRLLPHIKACPGGCILHEPDLVLDGLAIAFGRGS